MENVVSERVPAGFLAAPPERGTWRGTRRRSEYAQVKPEGGYCFVPAMAFLATWWAYRQGILGLADLRVWLALFEVLARRCGVRHKRSPLGVEHEIAALVGTRAELVRTALRKLHRTRFLTRSRTEFRPENGLAGLAPDARAELSRFVLRVRNHRRRVPVPRRLLRLLTSSKRPVLWATAIGHLLRCMYFRDGRCAPDGRCKASWIADVFGVDLRNVKASRRELVTAGLLIMDPTDQHALNRWGPRVRFNLAWGGPAPAPSPTPRMQTFAPRSPPPGTDRKLASRMENQEPIDRADQPCRPQAWRVASEDLGSPRGLQAVFERCTRLGLCAAGEAARLALFATAARALRVATSNPAGLFATLVRAGRWGYATLADEDRARRWMLQLHVGRDGRTSPAAPNVGQPQPRARGSLESAAHVLARVMTSVTPSRASVAHAPPRRGGRKGGEFEGETWNDGSPSTKAASAPQSGDRCPTDVRQSDAAARGPLLRRPMNPRMA